jgi:hypothetical protein
MIDTFRIGAYWNRREELLDTVINPTLKTLIGLSELDKQFSDLYELGMSRKEAVEYKVSLTTEAIKVLYKKRLKKNDIDTKGYSKIGYRLSVWTGHKDDEACQISFGVGSSSNTATNLCLIGIPTEGIARERLLQLDKVKEIIGLLIQNWNPDVVILNSRELSNALDTTNEVGWVTYTKKLKGRIKLSDKVVHEDSLWGGTFFI